MLHFWAGLDASVASLGASVFSLESTFSFVDSASSSLRGNIHARAAPAVPSPLWREKQRKVAQTKAQQPVKVVRTYRGTKAKFRNYRKQIKIIAYWYFTCLHICVIMIFGVGLIFYWLLHRLAFQKSSYCKNTKKFKILTVKIIYTQRPTYWDVIESSDSLVSVPLSLDFLHYILFSKVKN